MASLPKCSLIEAIILDFTINNSLRTTDESNWTTNTLFCTFFEVVYRVIEGPSTSSHALSTMASSKPRRSLYRSRNSDKASPMVCSLEGLYFAIICYFKGGMIELQVIAELLHALRMGICDEDLPKLLGIHQL